MSDYLDFITGAHPLYSRYYNDWKLCENSFYGGVEYKNARYLRAYQVDLNTPSETINTYSVDDNGAVTGKSKARLSQGYSSEQVNQGGGTMDGSFYAEKLDNTPLYNYVKLIVAEYNSILFRNPPTRILPDYPGIDQFLNDVDGEGNSITEFMSLVDQYTTIFGVCHVGCYKPIGSDIPRWKIHSPLDITNWSYSYDIDGNLRLKEVVVKVEETDQHIVYRHITPETIDTIFIGTDDDYLPPVDSELIETLDEGTFRISQPNELGMVPIVTTYQNVKVYNGVGTTVIQDVAQIQRSVYGDMAEIYSAITYGAHPTLVVDETTDQINDGQIGAEPGSVIRVQSGLTGEPSYVYEFASPQLTAIDSIKSLVDSKIDKMTAISMLRSEDLIKSARSGEQIEVYDDKLAALIRRKATNLESAESRLWNLYFAWTNQNKPEDFAISYNRQFNKKALEHELSEINLSLQVLNKYKETFGIEVPSYNTREEAEAEAQRLGGSGSHSHTREDGSIEYMPFATHKEYESATGVDSEEAEFEIKMRDKIRKRMLQLIEASTTSNGF
tara:strand:+ start:905 stop:2572 length:1668 start_codon:yes stop_codon:yes gene_type:complete